ncbi:MAG: metallophosphoesterase, partial [Bacteroidetes bacterium]|nr:metallophosphoesterase [Bacteroidota bacterium]
MTIQYCSDLHLEFQSNWNWLQENPLLPKGDILIIAGDTYYLGDTFSKHPFFEQVSKRFEQVFLIPGNHEFYGGFDANICTIKDYEIRIKENVHLVNNTSRVVDGVRFLFTTLWSKIEKEIALILRSLNDFRLINYDGHKLTIQQYNALFQYSWGWLKDELSTDSNEPTIVVTHHLPSN